MSSDIVAGGDKDESSEAPKDIESLRHELEKAMNAGVGPAILRFLLSSVGGGIPGIGGFVGAGASAWSEREQANFNRIYATWLKLQHDELEEIGRTLAEVMMRIDNTDEKITERIQSKEYLALLKKAFRDWSAAESEDKRVLLRNLLANAASSAICADNVIRLFIDWIAQYSETHFKVIASIYNHDGITRGGMWRKIGEKAVREDSAEADLFKLLIRDLSTGGIIRQHREVDYYGNFVKKEPVRRGTGSSSRAAKSAFDEEDGYELTELGKQFVHYTMNDLALRVTAGSESRDGKE
jgi:hemerythrin-like domain-containing protein